MKKAIFVIILTLVALVIGGSAIGCTRKTTPPAMDLKGIWSGTHVQSGPGFAIYSNMVMNVERQDGIQVWGTLAATVLRTEGGAMGMDLTIPFFGTVSGNTLTWKVEIDRRENDQHFQVSGNSMTGSGNYTDVQGNTTGWSYNLTRVR